MKNKILIFFLVFALVGCGTRKKTTDLNKNIQKENTEISTSTTSENTTEKQTEKTENSIYKMNFEDLVFSIKSPNGLPVYFDFISGGQKFRAETNGEINFSNQKKQTEKTSSKKEKISEKIHTTYKTVTNYKTHTTYKSILKNKKSESKRPSFAWYFLSFFIGLIFIPGIKTIFKK